MSDFEVRGWEVYPTWDNDRYEDSHLPVFEIKGTDVYPTIHNEHYDYTSSAAFEIRDGHAYPTYMNDDDDGFDIPEPGSGMSFGETLISLAMIVGLQARANAKERRREKAQQVTDSAPTAPPGWYTTDFGYQYWDGSRWTGQTRAAGFPTQEPTRHHSIEGGLVVTAWVITLLTVGYMLPWAIAVTRRTSNSAQIGWLCFLLGWTFVGWIVTLVMACSGRTVESR